MPTQARYRIADDEIVSILMNTEDYTSGGESGGWPCQLTLSGNEALATGWQAYHDHTDLVVIGLETKFSCEHDEIG
jgi:hypothetical protein